MRRLLLNSNDRAERGLLIPVMIELQNRDDVEAKWCSIEVDSPMWTKVKIFEQELDDFKPDIAVVPCDRFEAVYAAATAFHNGYIVAHLHAGNNPANHPDDVNRKAISTFSHILFCNMDQHKRNLIYQGEEAWRIHVVGSTAFDHINYDDSVTPSEPFSLVILHPDPCSELNTLNDIGAAIEAILEVEKTAKTTVWIHPNRDKNFDLIEQHLNQVKPNERFFKYKNLPKGQYMDLLSKCAFAIGNSSSFYYELPVVNPKAKLIQIGERNKGLVVPPTKVGGSKKIAEILATIPINEKLRRKWVVK